MIRRILLLGPPLSLAACETTQLNRDFDSSRDFATYRSRGWSQPIFKYRPDDPRIKGDLTEQRIHEAVAQQLDQYGLHPTQGNTRGNVMVRAYLIVGDRQDQITANYGDGHWDGYWGEYQGGPAIVETCTMNYKVATLQVNLLDGKDGRLVWRDSGEQIVRTNPSNPAEREQAIHGTVQKVMSQYPPR